AHGERCAGDEDLLIASLQNTYLRRWTAAPLARLKDPRTVQPLISALTYDSACAVGTALAELGDKSSTEPLLKFLTDPCVLQAVTRLNDSRAVPAIAALLREPDANTRVGATRALIAMNQCSLMPEIRQGLSDDSAYVRNIAAEAAGKCKDSGSVDLLIR